MTDEAHAVLYASKGAGGVMYCILTWDFCIDLKASFPEKKMRAVLSSVTRTWFTDELADMRHRLRVICKLYDSLKTENLRVAVIICGLFTDFK
ncbi:hypothetical protein HHI36_009687 [Cryptolaemus montrouzieri]|uniref:Uncharacterized protein n=1 Tax=Cryptolaemus montrouzieri TaxID=559131 RepID=A0ABD2MGH9_9CUCU